MAVPKRKKSKAKSRSRRANYLRMTKPSLSTCSSCGSPRPSHTICPTCGYYKNKIVVTYSE